MNRIQGIRIFLAAALGVLAVSDAAWGQERAKKPVNWNTKRVAIEMRDVPWARVFEWLADEAQMPVSSRIPPPSGTFTFVNPKDGKGKLRQYTLMEAFDIINEVLVADHRMAILRREATLTLVDLDEANIRTPWAAAEDLPKLDKWVIVRTVVKLRASADAEKIAQNVKRLLGEFGAAAAVDDQIIMRGPVKNLRVAIRLLADDLHSNAPAAAPPASPPPPAPATCESAPRWRPLARLLRR